MIPTFRGGNTNLFERQPEIYKQAGLGTDTFSTPCGHPRLRLPDSLQPHEASGGAGHPRLLARTAIKSGKTEHVYVGAWRSSI